MRPLTLFVLTILPLAGLGCCQRSGHCRRDHLCGPQTYYTDCVEEGLPHHPTGCHCAAPQTHYGGCGCAAPTDFAALPPLDAGCGCHESVGYPQSVGSDCGCEDGYYPTPTYQPYDAGPVEVGPQYYGPLPSTGEPQPAPPTVDEYYPPHRGGSQSAPQAPPTTQHQPATLRSTLIVPARL